MGNKVKKSALLLLIGLIIIVNFVYPTYYDKHVKLYSKLFDVDPHLVYGVIRTESRYNKDAISSRGAIGLMQVMESTGQEIFDKLNVADEYRDLKDPEANIMVGTYYLKELLEKYNGDTQKALAAYNSGMQNVKRWESQDIEFIDAIDYNETQNYILKVERSMSAYRVIYGYLHLGILSLPDFVVNIKIFIISLFKKIKKGLKI